MKEAENHLIIEEITIKKVVFDHINILKTGLKYKQINSFYINFII
jgi:hypothetical protein